MSILRLVFFLTILFAINACTSGENSRYELAQSGITKRKAKFSYYIPSRGGTNVSGDPATTASGAKVRDWYFGYNGQDKGNGVACSPILGFGTRVRLKNFGEFTCIDSGCGIRDTGSALWFDILVREEDHTRITNNVSYGDESSDWEVIEWIPHTQKYKDAWYGFCKSYLNTMGLAYIMMSDDEFRRSVPFGSGSGNSSAWDDTDFIVDEDSWDDSKFILEDADGDGLLVRDDINLPFLTSRVEATPDCFAQVNNKGGGDLFGRAEPVSASSLIRDHSFKHNEALQVVRKIVNGELVTKSQRESRVWYQVIDKNGKLVWLWGGYVMQISPGCS